MGSWIRDFRVTFDTEIRYRQEELTLDSDTWGTPILAPGQVLMEFKVAGRPAHLDGPCAVPAGNFQDVLFQIRHGISKYSAYRAERRTKVCLIFYFADCLTPR